MFDIHTNTWKASPVIEKLKKEKKSALELQSRKHEDWNDNYELYRNKVKTNRLTQRQPVNIPLMKETVKTLISKIDDAPIVDWKENGGDEMKELIFQEIWNKTFSDNKLELIDVLDKKNVLLYGMSTKKLNINPNGVEVVILDPYDVLYDPLMNPWDIESARFVIHQNIFRTVREILADKRYTEKGKEELKIWADSPAGIVADNTSKEEWEKKMERLKAMGLEHSDFVYFAGGDRIVNLTEHYSKIWNTELKKFEKRVIVYADSNIELLNEKLEDLIGVDFWPFILWSEDPEIGDIYPDSVADLVRVPNKVLNIWFSQLIENRTLKNFQMHWFLPVENYTPQTYTPGPGAMLPAPPGEDINKVLKPVEVSGLDDTLNAVASIIGIVEKATGATAIDKGQPEKGQQTLGEVQILVGKTMERAVNMAKFYSMAWEELAKKWSALLHANTPKLIKLSKTSKDGKIYEKKVFPGEWKSERGYKPSIKSSSEQEGDSIQEIQKFMFILGQFPNNVELRKIAQRRMLGIVDLSPDELELVKKAEEQPPLPIPQQQEQPQQESVNAGEIENLIGQLAT